MGRAIRFDPLTWDESNPDLRALTINSCVRRQRDALVGAIALGEAGQGHRAVAFVRAFLEERMWVAFLAAMTRSEANALLLAMGAEEHGADGQRRGEFLVLTEREEANSVAIASNELLSGWTKTFTEPRLCAAIVDRRISGANIIETGSDSYLLAHARAQRATA